MGSHKAQYSAGARLADRSRIFSSSAAFRIATTLIASLTIASFGDSAFAAEAAAEQSTSSDQRASPKTDTGLEEILVTAQLRREMLKDVPMSVSSVSGEALALQHVTNIEDLAFTLPNLDVAPLGLGQQIIAIRGVSGERGSSSLTGIYLNNIPVSGLQDNFLATYPDLGMYDLQRVEVLKGPQGTLFGEGAVGGVVHFLTNAPDLTKYSGKASLSTFDTDGGGVSRDLVVVANLPLVSNVFGVRLAGTVEDHSGWINQPSIDRNHINNNRIQDGRVELLWTPTSELEVAGLVGMHHAVADASDIVNQGSPQESNFTQGYFPHEPTNSWDRYTLANLSVTYHFGFADLLSSTSHINRHSMQDNTQVWSPDTVQDTVDFVGYGHDDKTTSQEFRLISAGEGRFKWVAGALYKDTTLTITEPLQLIALFNGGFVLTIPPFASTNFKSKSVAGYGDLSYQITRSLEIGAGIRYMHDARSQWEPSVSGSLESANFDVPTHRYFVSYSIADGVKVYANVGTGFRTGGFNIFTAVQLGAPATYGPEHDESYELGIKSTLFDRRVSFDAAAYYLSYRDLQDTVVSRNAQGAIIQYTGNQQTALARGVEWDAAWRVATNLTLHLAGDVMTTAITEASPVASYRVGDPINFVPRYSVMTGAEYRFNWLANLPGVAHIDFNRKGRAYDTLNGLQKSFGTPDQVSVPPLNFLNLSVDAMRNGWTFTVFGRNLTNERGRIRPGSSGWQSQARPLNVGIGVAKDF